MAILTDERAVNDILKRGVAEIISEDSLRKKLLSGKKLRIKYGIDPTSKNIHLGRAVALLKLRDLQALGHTIVFIVGDFTGVVGDTSDKESERPMLSAKAIKENMKTYVSQARKILSSKNLEIHYNSKWLKKLKYQEIGEQADAFSLADFIARENISKRLKAGTRVSMREVLYPIMQGYDSVATHADLEIGGTDQKFNMLAGRRLQERFGNPPQDILMTNIIEGTDGRKMSSSWGNTIDLLDDPNQMFGKIMSLSDNLMIKYFIHCTRVPLGRVEELRHALEGGTTNPRDMKLELAETITALYRGKQNAERAKENFISTFTKGQAPEDIPKEIIVRGTELYEAVATQKLVSSKTEWRRLIDEGAVENIQTGTPVNDPHYKPTEGGVFKIGKKRFIRINLRS